MDRICIPRASADDQRKLHCLLLNTFQAPLSIDPTFKPFLAAQEVRYWTKGFFFAHTSHGMALVNLHPQSTGKNHPPPYAVVTLKHTRDITPSIPTYRFEATAQLRESQVPVSASFDFGWKIDFDNQEATNWSRAITLGEILKLFQREAIARWNGFGEERSQVDIDLHHASLPVLVPEGFSRSTT